jgi:2-polyprenyl-3-methyl-5-hydroxy-6-metoxy-1,4-benzoquinol methylase
VLDVASGGGDVLLALHRLARRGGLDMRLAGCDVQPRAVEHARRRAEQAGADVQFFLLDALRQPLPGGYDVIMCSLFLHHLDEDEAVHLLGAMKSAAGRMVLVNDLERGMFAYAGIWLATRILTRSDVVAVDGPLSVRAAWRPDEALELAGRAGLDGATVRRRFPCRWVLTWERP